MFRPSDASAYPFSSHSYHPSQPSLSYGSSMPKPLNFNLPTKFKGAPNSGQSLGQNIPDVNWDQVVLQQIKKEFCSLDNQMAKEEADKFRKENDIFNNTDYQLPSPIAKFEQSAIHPSIIEKFIEKGFKAPTPI
jgi:hypothetical protein